MSPVRATFSRLRAETGTNLIETAVACALLLVVMAGLMGLAATATSITENQGHLVRARPSTPWTSWSNC